MIESYYAEYSTDKYIREIFFPKYSYGIMVEVGAGPPEFYSMSKHFRDNGWRCICIDPNPKFVKQHKDLGNEIYEIACSFEDTNSTFKIVDSWWPDDNINGISISALELKYKEIYEVDSNNYKVTEIPVKVKKLDSLLEELNIEKIDFLSVDTEGWEIEVMMGFNLKKYYPKVVLLENLLYLKFYDEYMLENGYKLNQKLEYNYIYEKINDENAGIIYIG